MWPGMSVRGSKNVLIKSGIPCGLLSSGCAFKDSSLLGLAMKSPWLELVCYFSCLSMSDLESSPLTLYAFRHTM